AIIRNYAALLQNSNLGAAEREQYASTLVSASARLTALVTNILKLNKLEHREIQPEAEAETFRLDEQLAQAVLQFEDFIEKKNLQVECELEETSVVSSPSYLEIVWNNLLSNAVKFTEAGGRIAVTLMRAGGKAVVKISDSGCGISQDTGRHIFEKFYQGDTSHAQEGNGLGLALVKKVIDTLGGEISVESELGKGSTFTVAINNAI
ncbi:MAG: HAMP domain-containing histidine kinase, partial [Clostridia bacterium]|nr:HAMP domain-containing histidine kinase [Clostridia bacterium]